MNQNTIGIVSGICLVLAFVSGTVTAGPREQAYRIHERIAGVPPTRQVLDEMASLVGSGDAEAAAYIAMAHPDFYRTTLKNFATPWTNRDFDIFTPLNDYSATIIGMVRDDVDFREVLHGDLIYTADTSPGYSTTSNAHYEALENNAVDLSAALVQRAQSQVTGLPADATAGVMTTRAAAKAFFIAGTNRAMFRFTLINHLCRDLEEVADTTRSPDRIRQDVTRAPGGDSRVFRNNCVGCHAGMDPMAQAFAYYNYVYDPGADPEGENGRLVYNSEGMTDPDTGSRVVAKYHFNENNFPLGFVTPDDRWDNYWREGRNQAIGWDLMLPGSGQGARSMGQELANSEAFASCQVRKVFRTVCLREPNDSVDRASADDMTQRFGASGYRLKQVFADAATYCMGE
ncbi:MAG: hypothetical protein ACFHX7_17185 [Pseudomonadota bacterium]